MKSIKLLLSAFVLAAASLSTVAQEIAAGESTTVEFEIRAEELAMAANDGKWHLEEGTFTIQCGNLTDRLTCTETAHLGYNIRLNH